MAKGASILMILAVVVVGQATTPSSYFTPADINRLKTQFASARPYGSDLESVYYSILGFSLIDEPLPSTKEACDAVKTNINTKDVKSVFYASVTANILKNKGKTTCQLSTSGVEPLLNGAINEESTTEAVYHAVAALASLNLKIDSPKVISTLAAILKKDDLPQSYAYSFMAASYLKGDLKVIHDFIEDVVEQADEVDETYLQFDGGLFTTALVIDGAYKLGAAANKAPTLSEDKVVKFTEYFLSRKHAQQLKHAAMVMSVVKTLTDNKYHIPITVSLASPVAVTERNPTVQVRVSNLLGQSLGKLTVTADTAKHLGDDAIILSKKPFTVSSSDPSLYEINLMAVKPEKGFYKIAINCAPQKADARLIGTLGSEVEVKVTTKVAIEDVDIGVSDKDQSTAPKTTKLQHPNKAANALEADYHQKIVMRFTLKDRTKKTTMVAHQAFVRLINAESQEEIIFVAEPDSTNKYKFDLDVGNSAKDFGYQSGRYSMEIIIGDAVIENSFSWTLADVVLTFQEGSAPKKQDPFRYTKKPEIKHMFREPEKRPAAFVSNLFTGLVILPLFVLIIVWMKLGVNLNNFPVSFSAIGFHVGLAAIFGLYYSYWTFLNMFQTLRYLGILCIPTFLCGNRLLSYIASKRNK